MFRKMVTFVCHLKGQIVLGKKGVEGPPPLSTVIKSRIFEGLSPVSTVIKSRIFDEFIDKLHQISWLRET